MTGTADFGKIISNASSDPACQLALDLFIDRVIGFIGSYYVKLEGKVDALVFAGGIGEKGAAFRKMVVEKVACLGFAIDDAKNDEPADETVADIGGGEARHRTLVCRTDEQVCSTMCSAFDAMLTAYSSRWREVVLLKQSTSNAISECEEPRPAGLGSGVSRDACLWRYCKVIWTTAIEREL